jgi:tripeptide aminopeptidase
MEKQIVDTFAKLTSINSPSGKEGDVARVLEDRLKELGFSCKRDKAGNIIGRRGEGEPLLLCCHMDTVKPNQELDIQQQGEWLTTDGNTILGADDKAGISVLLSVLPEVEEFIPSEVVFSVREEEGMKETLSLNKESLSARVGLVLDAGEPVGSVINQAPGETGVALWVKGKTAHAAVDPESGVDAIRLAARFLAALPEHRIDQDTSINFGVIRGGGRSPIISAIGWSWKVRSGVFLRSGGRRSVCC